MMCNLSIKVFFKVYYSTLICNNLLKDDFVYLFIFHKIRMLINLNIVKKKNKVFNLNFMFYTIKICFHKTFFISTLLLKDERDKKNSFK